MTAQIYQFNTAFQQRQTEMNKLSRILHVDDDDDIRSVVKMTLELVGSFDVCQCASGPEALEAVKTFKPQMFLLDFMMPGMDGEQTWNKLSVMPGMEDIPVVFMTAKAERKNCDHLMDIGALSVIVKPFDPATLCNEVESIWRKHSEMQLDQRCKEHDLV